MRSAYDRLAKEALVSSLRAVSRDLTPEREVVGDALRLDLWCVPDPSKLDALRPFGLLERVVRQGPCAFEFFHQAPSLDEVLRSLQKVLLLRQPARLPPRPQEPWLWVIAGGRPSQLLAPLHFEADRRWPKGIYIAPRALRTRLIVVSELPKNAETLLLRVLGAGKTLRDATRELRALGAEHPIRRIVLPIVVRLHLEYRTDPDERNQEFAMQTQDIYQEWLQRTLAEGEARGRAEGEARALLLVLAARGLSVSAEQAAIIQACNDPVILELWLSRAASATSCEEVLG